MSEDRELLRVAAKNLEKFKQITKCSICREPAEKMAQGIRSLEGAYKAGEEFIDKTQGLMSKVQEGTKAAERLSGENPQEEERPLRLFPTPAEAIRILFPRATDIINFAKLFPTPRDIFLRGASRKEPEE